MNDKITNEWTSACGKSDIDFDKTLSSSLNLKILQLITANWIKEFNDSRWFWEDCECIIDQQQLCSSFNWNSLCFPSQNKQPQCSPTAKCFNPSETDIKSIETLEALSGELVKKWHGEMVQNAEINYHLFWYMTLTSDRFHFGREKVKQQQKKFHSVFFLAKLHHLTTHSSLWATEKLLLKWK